MSYDTDRSRCRPASPGSDFAQPVSDGQAGAVGRERAGEVALIRLHVADLVVRYRQIALVVCAAGIAGEQVRHGLPGLLGGGERLRRVPDRQQRLCALDKRRGLTALEVRRYLPGFREWVLQRERSIENVFYETGGDPR